MKKNLKLIIFLSVQFLIVISICLVVLFDGKKNYTVTFNVNGGELVSGELVQSVRYGQSATPPAVTKEGFSLVGWSGQYNSIKENTELEAIWEVQTSYGLEFEIIGNYCLVSGCFDDISGNVYIGSFYNDKKILGIKENAFKDCKNINYIYISHGLISIGDNAFSGCSSLKSIDIPQTVETIGKKILYNCNQLESMYIPFIGNSIFTNTSPFLGYFFGGTSFSNGYRYVPSSLKQVKITTDYVIPGLSFYKCSNIEEIRIFGAVKTIESNAFRNCTGLKNIYLPDSLKRIDKASFVNCKSLTEIIFPNSLETVKEAVFANCVNLEKVTINSNLKNMELDVFQNCKKLTSFVINDNKNFETKDNKLYFVEGNNKTEYKIVLEEYKDEIDEIFVQKYPILDFDKFLGISEEEKEIYDKVEEL